MVGGWQQLGCGQWRSNTTPQQGNTFRSSRDPLDERHGHYLVSHLTDFSAGATTPSSASDQRVPSSHFPAFLPHIQRSYDIIYMPSVPIVEEPQIGTAVSSPSRITSLLGPPRWTIWDVHIQIKKLFLFYVLDMADTAIAGRQ